MTETTVLSKREVVALLTSAPHASTHRSKADRTTVEEKLAAAYLPVGQQAAAADPDFFAHLIAWNQIKGQVRDAKVALPIVALSVSALATASDDAYLENALAHVALLSPRVLLQKAWPFARRARVPSKLFRRLVARVLRDLEANPTQLAYQTTLHRHALHRLYALAHLRPGDDAVRAAIRSRDAAKAARVSPAADTALAALATLATAPTEVAVAAIRRFRLPWILVHRPLRARMKEDEALLAGVIQAAMTAEDAEQWGPALKKLGVGTPERPLATEAYQAALGKRVTVRRGGALKSTKMAARAEDAADATLAAQIRAKQEERIAAVKASLSVEGDWLVFGDISSSMTQAVDEARRIAALLATMVKGRVHLIFGNTEPTAFDATGKTYAEIAALTRRVRADGWTSLGCGLRLLLDRGTPIDGIALVTDGGENRAPYFPQTYQQYVARFGGEPTVYWYQVGQVAPAYAAILGRAGVDVQTVDLRGGVDDAGLLNLVQTMRVGRFSLIDEVQQTPLLTLDAVLSRTIGLPVLPRRAAASTLTID